VSELVVSGLRAGVGSTEILHGVDLTVSSGEVHVIMGPNGSGKSTLSHVVMGRPGYTVFDGSVTLDGQDMLDLAPWQRAHAGLFLALQYPTEVPGVHLRDMLDAATAATGGDTASVRERLAGEVERIGLGAGILERALNVDMSGGEKKRNETLQLAVLRPRIAVLDELDSGLDVDALRACSARIEALTNEDGLGVLAITHYNRLLKELRADRVHIMVGGRIVESGGPGLADELEEHGYARFGEPARAAESGEPARAAESGEPARAAESGEPARAAESGTPARAAEDPFADPLA
jgi:Fe-S cluster assembly ATP-binding protein